MTNSVGRHIPASIPGYPVVRPFTGAFAATDRQPQKPQLSRIPLHRARKVMATIQDVLEAADLRDGATISFHHHLRNGDLVLNMVLDEIASRGLKGIRVAASSLFSCHAPLIEHIKSGVVTGISTTYISGPLGAAIAQGVLAEPVVMQTHGGRARAIESGELKIDLAFVAAPTADHYGNCNGVEGPSACGPLGYAMVDVRHAIRVAVITDNLVPYPAHPCDITQDQVDFVVEVPSIGDPGGIASGTTHATDNPVGLKIAHTATRVIAASGLLADGFSFQTGAGGISLAVAIELKRLMHELGIKGSFASGGITAYLVDMLEEGLFRCLYDVQCFDLKSVDSYRRNPAHMPMSASTYANPDARGAIVDKLDVVILGAAEIDIDFNVNVTTGSNGVILGGSGGHADTAAGAKLAIVTTRLTARGFAKVVDRVTTLTTPGETIDVLVTEAGIAVNPARIDLKDRLLAAGIDVVPIAHLRDLARAETATPGLPVPHGRIVAVVEYRNGAVIDVVRAIP